LYGDGLMVIDTVSHRHHDRFTDDHYRALLAMIADAAILLLLPLDSRATPQ
jgi:hypothetical protein